MIALALARTYSAVRVRVDQVAYRWVPPATALKDLTAFPVCGAVRPLASQRQRAAR